MSASLSERTVSEIVGPNGEHVNKPTRLIRPDTAAIMRAWFYWAFSHQLEPELFCGDCAHRWSRNAKAIYNITETDIQIICGCQLRFFQGQSMPPEPIGASVTGMCDAQGVGQVSLSDGAARLMRLYKNVLLELNLKEALRCNACYALNQRDGCEAQVLTNSIRIRCRCSNRTYVGTSA